ncbi:MAG: TonB-dependent receptor plug domain-containing protein, partial [Epsilonproteobacteria bacterium]|nr:TonB-dependent receptor plug domain-containing protein [Campylobacterota bacterium]
IATALLVATNSYAQTTEDLGVITVTSATKSEQSIKDVTSNVEVITGVELEEKHITTLSDALNLVSGISFTSNGGLGATTSINLRGSDNNRVLVLIDGVKVKDHSSISGTDISQLLINNIEKIEVIKGAQSGIWGADASAGVINIITKAPKEGNSGTILAEVGSFKSKKYAGEFAHKSKDGEMVLNFLKLKSDGFTTQAPKGEDIKKYEDDGYENTTVGVKTKINLSDVANIGFGVTKIDAIKEYDSYNNPNDTIMKNDTKSNLFHLTYNQKINKHDIAVKYETGEIKRDQIGTTWGVKLTNSESSNLELKDTIKYNEKDFAVVGTGKNNDKINFTRANNTAGNGDNNSKFIYATNS